MGLRFFADHCVSNAMMQTLREGGHEVMRLREHLPVESPDTVVIAQAQQLDAILRSQSSLNPNRPLPLERQDQLLKHVVKADGVAVRMLGRSLLGKTPRGKVEPAIDIHRHRGDRFLRIA